ncbi:MAG: TonB-dependent receptor [Gammaproteobacteria bacterium]|nr:TonB-dependent receptor [Gammaproteobacteria bacterium]
MQDNVATVRVRGLSHAVIWLATSAGASGDPLFAEPIETVIVTSARRSSAAFEAPYTVHTVTPEQLRRNLVRTLPEALRETPGVMVQKTAHGQGSPFLRGFTGYRTLTLIDGVRYNNSVYRDGPNEYFSLIDFNAIDRIEILSGPAAVLYGSDAIGGTLNLTTRASRYAEETAPHYLHGAQEYRFSSADNSYLAYTNFEFGAGQQWGAHVGYAYKEFGDVRAAELGRQPRTGYGENAVDFRIDRRLSSRWDLTAVHQRLVQDDVWRTHATVYARSYAGTTVGTDLVRSKDQARSLSYLRLAGTDVTPLIHDLQLTLSRQTWDEDGNRIRANRRQLLEGFDSRMWGLDLAFETHTEIASFSYGLDYYQDDVDSRGIEFAPNGDLREIKIQGPLGDDASYGLFSAYVQAELPLYTRLAVTAGSRFTYTAADIERFEEPTSGLPASFEDHWAQAVHSLRAIYDVVPGSSKLWVGVSEAFRAPNIADLSRFGASRSIETEIAATGLGPEKFLTYELGLKTQDRGWQSSATYYYTRIHDFITSTPTGRMVDGLIEVSKTNSASGFVHGIELAGHVALNAAFSVFANITWLESRLEVLDSTSLRRQREPLSRMMPLTSNFGLDWSSANKRSSLACVFALSADADRLSLGDLNDSERIPPGGTPGYFTLALRAQHRVMDHLMLTLALENVLDEAYRSHGSGSNEAGLGVKLGVRVSF